MTYIQRIYTSHKQAKGVLDLQYCILHKSNLQCRWLPRLYRFENDIPLFLNVASIFQGETGSKEEKACTLTLVHHLLKQNVNHFVQMIGQDRNGKSLQNEDVAMKWFLNNFVPSLRIRFTSI